MAPLFFISGFGSQTNNGNAYKTDAQLSGSIPVNVGMNYLPENFITIYRMGISNALKRPVFLAANFEVTTKYYYNLMVAYGIKRNGVTICSPTGTNINLDIHHHNPTIISLDLNPETYSIYEVYAYCASTSAKHGDAVNIEQGYGEFDIVIL